LITLEKRLEFRPMLDQADICHGSAAPARSARNRQIRARQRASQGPTVGCIPCSTSRLS
jgi:hypothetical protein